MWVTDEVKWLGEELLSLWPGLASPNKHSLKTRRYLCSLDKQYLLDRLKQ